jgi:hypothetical protein
MVANEMGKSYAMMHNHSSNWKWLMRLDAYAAELDKERRVIEEEARREMHKRHIDAAMAIQAKAVARLASIEPAELTTKEVLQWVDAAIKIERAARADVQTGNINTASDNQSVNNVQININADHSESNLASVLSILERSGALKTIMAAKEGTETKVLDVYREGDEDNG